MAVISQIRLSGSLSHSGTVRTQTSCLHCVGPAKGLAVGRVNDDVLGSGHDVVLALEPLAPSWRIGCAGGGAP